MNKVCPIDTSFDFRLDTPEGKDPDTWSPTLSRYHKLLWSKPLPGGDVFALDYKKPPYYFNHSSELGEFCLSSDTVVPSFRKQKSLCEVFAGLRDEMRVFNGLGYTMGGMMLFPAIRINGKATINAARGFHPRIKDRFDYTVECIRRHYLNEESPLSKTLKLYPEFFSLFVDFRGYVEFFLLQDLVSDDFESVNFFTPFDGFQSSPVPKGREAFLEYRAYAIDFLNARNKRIRDWALSNL